MGGDTELGSPVHVPGADLQLDRLAPGTDDGGVQGLVHVELRHRDEVLEAPGHGAPAGVDDAEHGVAVADRLDQDPHADEVVDVGELATAYDHLLVDGVEMLRPTGHGCFDASAPDIRLELVDHAREVLVARGRPLGHESLDLVVHLGIERGEGEILELPLHGVDPEPVRQRRVDLERLPGLLLLLLRRHESQSAHVVETIRQLDDEHADVACHGHDHLADCLRCGGLAVGHPVELGHAVDQVGYLVAEVLAEFVEGIARVLDRVVQECGRQRGRRHAELGEDGRHSEGMGDVGIPGAALLVAMQVGSRLVGPLQDADVGLRVVLPERADQGIELGRAGPGTRETSQAGAQASGAGVSRDLAHRLLRHPHLPLL